MEDEEPQDALLPSNPKEVVKVIQYKYYEIINLHEELLNNDLNGRYDLRMARKLMAGMFTIVQLVKNYEMIKKNKDIQKSFKFIEKFIKTRYTTKNKDIKPQVLFDLVNDITLAYNELGISDIEVKNE